MELRTKLGQMVSVGFEGLMPPQQFLDLIRLYKIGNVSLYAHNLKNKQQTLELVSFLKDYIHRETGFIPFISADQEGGMVTRFSKDFTHFPGAMATAATGNTENAFRVGYHCGLEIKNVGLNANFAPVVDVNTNSRNPVIGVRAYGDTVEAVTAYAMRMMDGLEKAGVMSVLKHFPGHGDTYQDSHFALPRVDKNLDQLFDLELKPYIEGIRRGAPAIMTSHIVFPNIDPSGLPATMSRVIMHDLLREKLHFDGIVRTDDLEMEAIRREFGIIPGALAAVKAGVDIISISRSPALGAELVEILEKQIASGELDEAIIDASFNRIIKCKKRYCQNTPVNLDMIGCDTHREIARNISRSSIALYKDPKDQLPVKGRVLVVGTNAFNQTNVRNPLQLELNMPDLLSKRLGGQGITVATQPTPEQCDQVLAAAAHADTVVFGTYNAHLFRDQLTLADKLSKAHPNVIFVAMRNPYDLPLLDSGCAALAAYEYTPLSIETLGDILAGQHKPLGSICVKLD